MRPGNDRQRPRRVWHINFIRVSLNIYTDVSRLEKKWGARRYAGDKSLRRGDKLLGHVIPGPTITNGVPY